MTIQERALNEKQFGSKNLALSEVMKKSCGKF